MKYYEADGYYLNKLSAEEITRTLMQKGLKHDEFVIRSQPSGNQEIKNGTVIEIQRKS